MVACDVFVTWAEVCPVIAAADEKLVPPVVEAKAELVTSGLDGDELPNWTVVASDVFVTWAEVRPVIGAVVETPVDAVDSAEAVVTCEVELVETKPVVAVALPVVCVATGEEVVSRRTVVIRVEGEPEL